MSSESYMGMQVNFDYIPLRLMYPKNLPELPSLAGSLSDLYLLEEDATSLLASENQYMPLSQMGKESNRDFHIFYMTVVCPWHHLFLP